MNTNTKYTPDYKSKIVLETLKGEKSIKRLAKENNIPANKILEWKQEFLEAAPEIFALKKVTRVPKECRCSVSDADIDPKAYIAIIRQLRTDSNLSVQRVADYLGISHQIYSRYEAGTTALPITVLKPLAKLYNVSTDYILGLDNNKNKNTQ